MRRAAQLALLALFVYLLALTRWPLSDAILVDAFLVIDPLLSIQAAIAGRTWVSGFAYGLLMLGLAAILGRFFCGWMCPFGTCLELGDDLVYRKKKRKWRNHERHLRYVKYIVLAVIIIAAIFGQGLAYLADPICWATRLFTYALWPMGAGIGNVGLDLLRPIFEYFGWMNLARATFEQPVFGSFGIIAVIFFAVLVWLGRYQRRFWCRVLCPLGALLALPARFTIFHRTVGDACDEDGKCRRVCETGAIDHAFKKYDPGECIQCQKCVSNCHLDVVKFAPTKRRAQSLPKTDMTRRHLIGAFGIGAFASAWLGFNSKRTLINDEALRPPGALPENDFLATCVRCGQCVKACPTNCLQPCAFETGVAGLMTPTALMRLGPCDQNCNVCGQVCPTGAIRALDFIEKPFAKIGNAVIEPGRCLVWEQERLCLVCDEHCPYGAIYWKEVAGGARMPFINENRCNGCGQCEEACPVTGVAAVRVYPAGQIRLKEGSYEREAAERGLDLRRIENIDY
jgi:MauM/NapG family ferredoxin protein